MLKDTSVNSMDLFLILIELNFGIVSVSTLTQEPSKEQLLSHSLNSSLIIPVPTLHFTASTPNGQHQHSYNGSLESLVNTTGNTSDISMISPNGPVEPGNGTQTTGDLVLAAISVMKANKIMMSIHMHSDRMFYILGGCLKLILAQFESAVKGD